jgi:GT2 family glycosyltransferase
MSLSESNQALANASLPIMAEPSMTKESPKLSIVIVSWNSSGYMERCLQHLVEQTWRDFEVILVDNASSDETVIIATNFAQAQHLPLQVLHNNANLGYAIANNRGIAQAKAELVLLLNTDAFLPSTFLATLLEQVDQHPQYGSYAPKIVRDYDHCLLDSTGLFVTKGGKSHDRGYDEVDIGQYERLEPVFAPCGAIALYRKAALERIKWGEDEYFDANFFLYYEDTDLGWRLQRAGYQCLYLPSVVGYHVRGGSVNRKVTFFQKSLTLQRHTIKNRYLMLLKNLSLSQLVRQTPALLLFEIKMWGYILLRRPQLASVIVDVVKQTKPTWRKRYQIGT